ncbi:response to oxidative stress [Nesidiocoris tenuis]|uniref:Response to oxidative stress n=1 Tax=Nesidiocoris tenuis TaxID=355587 RepID=A0ABN7A5R6_9HEMI|nr:response to oxidative stress [Nesidiocoris tenuis]
MGDSKKAVVLIAEGSEEMEAVITIDVLRRAGVNVTVAGLKDNGPVKCSRDVVLVPDASLTDALKSGPYDAVILPGGLGGSKLFCESAEVGKLLKEQEASDRIIGAICAAPTALKSHGIGLGKSITSYPGVGDHLSDSYKYLEDKVVISGKLVTSRGPGTAFDFGLALAGLLAGKEKADAVAKGLLLL